MVESATRGEADLRRMEAALNRVADVAERSTKRTADASKRTQQDTQQFASNLKNAIQNPLDAAGQAAENFALRFGKVGVVAAGAAVGIGVVADATYNLVKAQGAAAEAIVNLADRTGLTINQIDRLQASAKIAGVDIGVLERAAKGIAETLVDVGGANEKAIAGFRELGVQVITDTGKQRDYGQVLFESIEALSKVEDQTKRTALASAILGRGSQELQPLIKKFQDLDQAARDAGFGTRESLITALADADDEMGKFGLRVDVLKGQLAGLALDLAKFFSDAQAAARKGGGFSSIFNSAVGFGARVLAPAPKAFEPFGPDASLADPAARNRLLTETGALRTDFLTKQKNTINGIETALKAIADERKSLLVTINAAENPTLFKETEKKLANLERQERTLQDRMEALRKARASATLTINSSDIDKVNNPLNPRRAPSLFRPGLAGSTTAALVVNSADINAANAGTEASISQRAIAQIDAIQEREEKARQRSIRSIADQAEFQARLVDLLTGPGGELDAVAKVAQIRLEALEKEKAFNTDLFDIEQKRAQILQDAQLRALEIQRKRLDDFKAGAGEVFDALISRGGGGIADFARGQALTIGRQLFQNTAGELFGGASGRLTLPGQRGSDGSVNMLGRLLSGTPFADTGLKTATEINTLATAENTAALRAVALSPSGGGGGIPSLAGLPSGLFGGAGSNPFIFSALPSGPGGLPVDPLALASADASRTLGLSPSFTSNNGLLGGGFGRGVATAGALAASGFGIYSGIKQGGGRGALTASGSALGGLAAILPLLGVAGPVAPILAAGALGVGLVSSLLGDPKQKRDEELQRLVDSAQYTEPVSTNFGFAAGGGGFDYNVRGGMRPIVVQVQTLDSKSFEENSDRIAGAVEHAMYMGHSINRTAREVVLSQ